jgi:hypothetical protein
MEIIKILSSWNKNIKLDDDTFFWDELYKCYPQHFYVIDQYPMPIKDNSKFKQLDIFYDAISNDGIYIDVYKNVENKLKNVIRKLWAYNLVEVETNFNEKDKKLVMNVIDHPKKESIENLQKKIMNGSGIIDSVELLDVLVEMGARERAYSCFVFHDYRIIAVTNALDMPVFISDINMKGVVDKIVTTEGLYLRQC